MNVDGEQTLVAVRASAGSTTLVMGPGSMKVSRHLAWLHHAAVLHMASRQTSGPHAFLSPRYGKLEMLWGHCNNQLLNRFIKTHSLLCMDSGTTVLCIA